jgi:hypothetical protein
MRSSDGPRPEHGDEEGRSRPSRSAARALIPGLAAGAAAAADGAPFALMSARRRCKAPVAKAR